MRDRCELFQPVGYSPKAVLRFGDPVDEASQRGALGARHKNEAPSATVLLPAPRKIKGTVEAVAEPDINEVGTFELHFQREVVDHRGRAVEQHRSSEVPNRETQLVKQPTEGPVGFKTPTSLAVFDDLVEHVANADRRWTAVENLSVFERHRNQMGEGQPRQTVDIGRIRPLDP